MHILRISPISSAGFSFIFFLAPPFQYFISAFIIFSFSFNFISRPTRLYTPLACVCFPISREIPLVLALGSDSYFVLCLPTFPPLPPPPLPPSSPPPPPLLLFHPLPPTPSSFPHLGGGGSRFVRPFNDADGRRLLRALPFLRAAQSPQEQRLHSQRPPTSLPRRPQSLRPRARL